MSHKQWEHHLYFPTRVITCEAGDDDMRRGLLSMFEKEDRFRSKDYASIADLENLIEMADRYPAIMQLHEFMKKGMMSWLEAENIKGNFTVHSNYFANYSKRGEFVPFHNHIANISGVYYVDVPDFSENDVMLAGDNRQYWKMDYGTLLLHDPRYNSSLAELDMKNYVKVFPRAGMGIIFPSYLGHSVTPHNEEKDRKAISVNFTLIAHDETPMHKEEIAL